MSTGGNEKVGGIEADMQVSFDRAEAELRDFEQRLQKTRAAIEQTEDALALAAAAGGKGYGPLKAELDQLRTKEAALTAAIRDQTATVQRHQQVLDGTVTATTRVQVGMRGVAKETGSSAMGFMMLSQFIDDAQYGFRAIVNNVPMVGASMAQSMGMGTDSAMKLGGALGIAAVAVNTWINNWDSLKANLNDLGWLDTLTNKLDELKKSLTDPGVANSSWLKALAGTAGPLGVLAQYLAPGLNVRNDANRAAAQAQQDAVARQQAQANLRTIRTPEAVQTGRAIRETIEATGGGQSLADALYRQQATGPAYTLPAGADAATRQKVQERQDLLRGQLARMITEAIGGDEASQRSLFQVGAETDFGHQYQFHAPGYQAQLKQATAEQEARARQEQKEADEIRADQDKRAQQRAEELAGGALGLRATTGGQVGTRDVRAALLASGETEESADFMVGEVYDRFTAAVAEAVRKRALTEGKSEAAVRQEIAAEEQKKAEQTRQQATRAATQRAGEVAPGLEYLARYDLAMRRGQGSTIDQSQAGATADVQQRLQASGLSADQAALAAGELVADALKRARQQAAQGADPLSGPGALMRFLGIQAPQQPEARAPEFVSPAEMMNKVQLAALSPENKQERLLERALDVQTDMRDLLEQIQGGVPAVAT